MADTQMFELGWEAGAARAKERRERKQALEDEQRQFRVADWYDQGHKLAATIPSLTGDDRDKAMSQLTDIEQNIADAYHPVKAPGALQRDWHFLANMIMRKPRPQPVNIGSYDAVTTPDVTFTPPASSVTLPATPGYQRTTVGATPSAISRVSEAGTAPSEEITLPSAPVSIPGSTYNVRPAAEIMSKQQRQQMTGRDQARRAAEQAVGAAGLSPEQQVESAMQTADRLMGKDWNPDERERYRQGLLYAAAGITPKGKYFGTIVPMKDPVTGEESYYRVPQEEGGEPERIDFPTGQKMVPKTVSADAQKRADYADYRKRHPEYTGTFEQWSVEQGQLGRLAVPTQRDDRYLSIEEKRQSGQRLTPDEQAYANAYDLYINKRVINPAVARAAAMGADRYVQIMDPSDPERVIFARAGDAARAGAGSPQSISFKTDAAITKYMTAGPGGQNINFFRTASDHLQLLGEASDALNNGDLQLFNKWGNAFEQATGDPAPTDFNAVKNAVAGELSKTFRNAGATDQEIGAINQTINNAMSPQQLHGAINYYTRLMNGKINALRAQYEAGKSGQPAFPAAPGAPSGASPKGGARPRASPTAGAAGTGAKGSRSIAQVKQYFQSHPQQAQKTFGTASPSEPQVVQYIEGRGYVATQP